MLVYSYKLRSVVDILKIRPPLSLEPLLVLENMNGFATLLRGVNKKVS